jgi:imidazolonepropionase-like amidohydrolase
MRQQRRYSTLFGALLVALCAPWLTARDAARAYEGEAYALRGGTVVTVTGALIQRGTVVIRNGLIEAVGAGINVPADAKVIDTTGMNVYPGLIDSYTNYGLAAAAAPTGGGGRGGGPPAAPATVVATQTAPATAATAPSGQSPELMASDQLRISAETFDQQRSAGITTALIAPREGIYQGQSVLLNLGGDEPDKLIIRNPVSLNIAFGGGRGFGGGGFPGSGMGVFAFLRQSLLDAQWYREAWKVYNEHKRGLQRPESDKSLAALQPVISGELPVIMAANSVRELQRAVGLAEEFKLKYLLAGGLQSYQIADWLKSHNATVLLSVNFPQRPTNLEDPESESLRTLRDRADAPKSAAALHKAGVRFALQSGYASRPADFVANVAKAIEAGLPKDAALKALTIVPAEIFGVAEQLGSIEKGKIANLVVTSGDLFDRRTQIKHVFVDGKPFEVRVAPPAMAGPPGRGGGPGGRPGGGGAPASLAAGDWSITTQTPQGAVQATLSFRQEGNALSGQITTPFGTAPVSGQINGNEVSFSFSLDVQGERLNVSSKGTLEGNTIKGKMYVMDQEHEFSGTRTPRQ